MGTRFVMSYGRTDGRTDELLDYNNPSWPKGPRAKNGIIQDNKKADTSQA